MIETRMLERLVLTFFLVLFCQEPKLRAESPDQSERCAFYLRSDHTLYLLQQLGQPSKQSRQLLIEHLFEIYKHNKIFVQLDEQDELRLRKRIDNHNEVLSWLQKLEKTLQQRAVQLPAFSTVILSSFSFIPPGLMRADFQINMTSSEADIQAYLYEEALLLPIRQKRRKKFLDDLANTSRRTRLKWTLEALIDPSPDQFAALLSRAEAFILSQDFSRLEKVSKIRLINQYQRDPKPTSPGLLDGVIDIFVEDPALSLSTSLNHQLIKLEEIGERRSRIGKRFFVVSVLLQLPIGTDRVSHYTAFEYPEKIESLLLWIEEFFGSVPESDLSVVRIGFNQLPINHISGAGEKTLWISIHGTKRDLFVWLSRIRLSSGR
jgi:hypothetical protein